MSTCQYTILTIRTFYLYIRKKNNIWNLLNKIKLKKIYFNFYKILRIYGQKWVYNNVKVKTSQVLQENRGIIYVVHI